MTELSILSASKQNIQGIKSFDCLVKDTNKFQRRERDIESIENFRRLSMFEGDLFCLCRPVSCAREVAAGKEPARVETVARNTQWAVGKFGRQVGNSRGWDGQPAGEGGQEGGPWSDLPV